MKKIKYLAIIPARAGSERIKDKNLIIINGTPLIGIAIKEAIKTKLFSKVIISTDSKKYYEIAKNYGADSSFIRPKNISSSTSSDFEHINFQIEKLKKNKETFDVFVILRPTSPFRNHRTIKRAIKIFEKNSNFVDSLRAVRLVKDHPFKMWAINGLTMSPIFPFKDQRGFNYHSIQKKSLPELYIQSAMIEISWIKNLEKKSISGDRIMPFLSTEKENFDINEPEDLIYLDIFNKKH